MAIGKILQEARLKKHLTTSQVAELTRMKIQIVDDLEHDDFHRLAATIYGKGFIKLFAEAVDLDPRPLIDDYLLSIKGGPAPDVRQAIAASSAAPRRSHETPPETTPPEPPEPLDLFAYASSQRTRITPAAPHSRPAEDGHPRDATPAPEKHRTRSVKSPLSRLLKQRVLALRERNTLLGDAIKGRLANLRWSDRFIKVLAITLAILVLLGILIPVIRHLVTTTGPKPLADDELMLFTEPPEPYVD